MPCKAFIILHFVFLCILLGLYVIDQHNVAQLLIGKKNVHTLNTMKKLNSK